jgi:hypothetical protein
MTRQRRWALPLLYSCLLLSGAFSLGCDDDSGGKVVHDLSGSADQSVDLALQLCKPPSTVPDPYVVKLQLKNEESFSNDNILVEMRKHSDDSVITSGMTDNSGAVTLTTASGGKPVDAYLMAHPGGVVDAGTLAPQIMDIQGGLFLSQLDMFYFSEAAISEAGSKAGLVWNTANGVIDIYVSQCNLPDSPIEGATVSTMPSGDGVFYTDNTGKFNNQLTATSTNGRAGTINQPPGAVEIDAHYMGGVSTYTTKVHADTYHHIVVFP